MKGFAEGGGGSSVKDRSHGISLSRDDRVHGSLLIMIELFMNCVLKAEVSACYTAFADEVISIYVVNNSLEQCVTPVRN